MGSKAVSLTLTSELPVHQLAPYMLGGNTNVYAVSAVRYLYKCLPALEYAFRLASSRRVSLGKAIYVLLDT